MSALLTGPALPGADRPAPARRGAPGGRHAVRTGRVPASGERLPSPLATAHAKEPSMTTLELSRADRHAPIAAATPARRPGAHGGAGTAGPTAAPPATPATAHDTTTTATTDSGEPGPDAAGRPGETRPRAATPTDPHGTGSETPARAPAPARSPGARPTTEAHLVPTLPPAPRPAPGTGPGHTRPPTLEQRLLARRRATLAAERAARAADVPRETTPMPDPTPVCCALALAATEALRGTRSVAQLARWVSPPVFEQLAGRAALTVRVLGRTTATRRPEILRVRVCRLGEHVAEAAVVVDDGTRVRAIALRLEMWRGAWRAVAFEIG